MCVLLMFQNQNRFKQMLLNPCGHSLNIIFSCTPPPLLGWWITFTGKSTQLQFITHTAESQSEMFTLLQYKQNFTISKFTISRFQHMPLLVHSCCFMWDRIQKFFRCFVSWRKTQDHYSDLDLTFRKQQLQVGTQMADMMAVLWRNYISISSSAYDAECKHWCF